MTKQTKKKNNKSKNSLPTQVELFLGAPSALAVAAFQRSGGGVHQDRKTRRKRTRSAKRAAAFQEQGL